MKKYANVILTGSLVLSALLCGSGCDDQEWMKVFKSEKRVVKRQILTYQAALSKGDFVAAAKFHPPQFRWIKGGKTYEKGATSAFLESVKKISDRTAVLIYVNDMTKLSENKYLIKARFQVRGNNAVELKNTKWDVSMVWAKANNGKWYVLEIKELTGRDFSKS